MTVDLQAAIQRLTQATLAVPVTMRGRTQVVRQRVSVEVATAIVEVAFPPATTAGNGVRSQVEDVLDTIDDEHYAADHGKYCAEGSCAICQIIGRLNAALDVDKQRALAFSPGMDGPR